MIRHIYSTHGYLSYSSDTGEIVDRHPADGSDYLASIERIDVRRTRELCGGMLPATHDILYYALRMTSGLICDPELHEDYDGLIGHRRGDLCEN